MTGRIFFNEKKSPIHAVVAEPGRERHAQREFGDNGETELMAALGMDDPEDMTAAGVKCKGEFNRGGNAGGDGGVRNTGDMPWAPGFCGVTGTLGATRGLRRNARADAGVACIAGFTGVGSRAEPP